MVRLARQLVEQSQRMELVQRAHAGPMISSRVFASWHELVPPPNRWRNPWSER